MKLFVGLCVVGIFVACSAHSQPAPRSHPKDTKKTKDAPVPHSKKKVFNAVPHAKADYECPDYPCLIFEDTFDTLDLDTWEPEKTMGGGGNWEFQYYDNNRSTSFVRDGQLILQPIPTSDKYGEAFLSSGMISLWGHQPHNLCTGNAWYGCERVGNPTNFLNPIQSARLRSAKSFNLKYGRVEVEAKLPKGDWLWPAIWMLPKNNAYGDWPASGEIDLVEIRGNLDLQDEQGNQMGHTHAGATLHWGPYLPFNGYEKTMGSRDGNWADEFVTYAVEWDDASLRIYFDDDLVLETEPPAGGFWEMGNEDWNLPDSLNPWAGSSSRMAPFDQEAITFSILVILQYYIILNVAVGGTGGFFPDSWTNAGYPKPWADSSETGPRDFWERNSDWLPTWNGEDAAMVINSVRAYKLSPDQ
ncbi:hypothetical protein CAPTEDRAFT_222704 [Capitella teleta]|uniref:GH16 domain-containing protein n=1 Tax=Capitella teleta TaxID=283909 RepID=R7TFX2_CAPTE|nr:hypothetical protein CAPTEDRAFT_222704 [Capitella teleta]|eukprot:ELT90436.1 hypothetical protein CAPTEDRAFT_222704 [Capitella teleta]